MIGIGMKCPTTKLEVSPTVNPKFIDKLINY
jgi:hypothetical protein